MAGHEPPSQSPDRFPADVQAVLTQAGWFPGRDVTPTITQWSARFAGELAGLAAPATARSMLAEFGGLRLPQFGLDGEIGGGFTSYLHPLESGLVTDSARVFAEEYQNPVYPVGANEDGPSELVIDADGRVFMLHWVDEFHVATGIDAALVALIRGHDLVPASELTW